ncbi:hypothetical protein RBH20_07135 [Haloarcula sp. H-GB4]|uniref:hypothetical protein n=1 Tax=Haloarcula sp. H-GB4 TaxID=3069755 RepID=UPI0027B1338E|nr:hypothetical protein [Haloarcula sp. H-GB4]MDQ2072314.1 hypothetical protein [Haloarcula sp. H-GB4]
MTGAGDSRSAQIETTALSRRKLLAVTGLSGLSLFAGCGGLTGNSGTGIDVLQDGSRVSADVTKLDFTGATSIEQRDSDTVGVDTAIQSDDITGIDATLGSLAVDSLHVGTDQTVTFGDNEEFDATFDSETQRLELSGSVQLSNGTLKGPYDTNNHVHDMILPGMHPHATDAVGAQDNVLGFADAWADVSHTPLSAGAGLHTLFKPGPKLWAGWNQSEDFPAQITIEDLSEDWGPGRAMVMFRDQAKPQYLSIEVRSSGGNWEQVATKENNSDAVVILDLTDASPPITAMRWTFAEPETEARVHLTNLFYFSMSVKGNSWLPKARGETTDITFIPKSSPSPPETGVKLFTDANSGALKAIKDDGTEQQLDIDTKSREATTGSVTLTDGEATIATGISEPGTHLSVHLDPTGNGANDCCVSVNSSVRWDSTDDEYKIDVVENDTTVGDPVVGYKLSRL